MSIETLKEDARRHEQDEEWDKALEERRSRARTLAHAAKVDSGDKALEARRSRAKPCAFKVFHTTHR